MLTIGFEIMFLDCILRMLYKLFYDKNFGAITNDKAQMSNPPASPERERWQAGQIQMLQYQSLPVWTLDFDIYPVKFPLFGAGPLRGFNRVNLSFELWHLTFSRYTAIPKSFS
jgi:hypothetical protein